MQNSESFSHCAHLPDNHKHQLHCFRGSLVSEDLPLQDDDDKPSSRDPTLPAIEDTFVDDDKNVDTSKWARSLQVHPYLSTLFSNNKDRENAIALLVNSGLPLLQKALTAQEKQLHLLTEEGLRLSNEAKVKAQSEFKRTGRLLAQMKSTNNDLREQNFAFDDQISAMKIVRSHLDEDVLALNNVVTRQQDFNSALQREKVELEQKLQDFSMTCSARISEKAQIFAAEKASLEESHKLKISFLVEKFSGSSCEPNGSTNVPTSGYIQHHKPDDVYHRFVSNHKQGSPSYVQPLMHTTSSQEDMRLQDMHSHNMYAIGDNGPPPNPGGPPGGDGSPPHHTGKPFDDDNVSVADSVCTEIFNDMDFYEKCYYKIGCHLKEDRNIDDKLDIVTTKCGDSTLDAINALDTNDTSSYHTFQRGEVISQGLEKRRIQSTKNLLGFLDPTMMAAGTWNSKISKGELALIPSIDKMDALSLARLVEKHVRSNLRTYYAISPDIHELIKSFNGATNLFERPRHDKIDGYGTIVDMHVREKYVIASKILYEDLKFALSKQLGKLALAQAVVAYGPQNKLSTKCQNNDGVQLLFALLCTRLPNMNVIKLQMKIELTTAAMVQFDTYDPLEVVDQLSPVAKRSEDLLEGRPKILYEDAIGNIAQALIFRVNNFSTFLTRWVECADATYAEDCVPLIQSFYADIKRAVVIFRGVNSFDNKSFWSKCVKRGHSAITADVQSIIDTRSKAYTAVKTQTSGNTPFRDTQANVATTVVLCQSITCGALATTGKGYPISPKFLKLVPNAQLCALCYSQCVKTKSNVQLENGKVFEYKDKPSRGKGGKHIRSTDATLRKYAKMAGEATINQLATEFGLHLEPGNSCFRRTTVPEPSSAPSASTEEDTKVIVKFAEHCRKQESIIEHLKADAASTTRALPASSSNDSTSYEAHIQRICSESVEVNDLLAKQQQLEADQLALTAQLSAKGYNAST